MFRLTNDPTTKYTTTEAAMKAYAKAGFPQGVKIEEIKDVAIPAMTETASGWTTGAEATVSPIAAERIERHETLLADMGIALPPPLYTSGTRVVAAGHTNFRTSRQEWENLPETVEGLRQVWKAVKAEERQDRVVTTRTMRMLDDGTVACNGSTRGVRLEER
ncbi:MAG TPA: hypothetical protein VFH61_05975, partial [Thermoleophilia bacterium]|nr:hypothetical protein [Thermoleophilia bacterium]